MNTYNIWIYKDGRYQHVETLVRGTAWKALMDSMLRWSKVYVTKDGEYPDKVLGSYKPLIGLLPCGKQIFNGTGESLTFWRDDWVETCIIPPHEFIEEGHRGASLIRKINREYTGCIIAATFEQAMAHPNKVFYPILHAGGICDPDHWLSVTSFE